MNAIFNNTLGRLCRLLPLAIVALFTACADYFEPRNVIVDLPEHENLLVISGFLNPDSVFQVSVAQSTGFLQEPQNPFVSTARVELFESNQLIASLSYTSEGRYQMPGMTPEIGQTYGIRVFADGFEPVQATTRIPEPIAIDSVKSKFRIEADSIFSLADLTISFSDPAGQDDFYHLLLYETGPDFEGNSRTRLIHFFTRDGVLQDRDDFEDTTWHWYRAWFDDTLFDGQDYQLKISTPYRHEFTDAFEVVLLTTSASYHRYFKTLAQQQETEENPFAEPVQVFTNIEGGLGIFTAFSASKVTVNLQAEQGGEQ